MGKASQVAVTVTLAFALLTSTAGCSLLPIVAQQGESPSGESSEEAPAESDGALNSYVEAERAQIPTIIEQYPDLYSDVSIAGALEESTGDEDIPAGPHSTIRFTYTYADEMDWEATGPALDAQGTALEDACTATIFPAMNTYGVEGPVAAVFEYTDAANSPEIMWSYACSDEG